MHLYIIKGIVFNHTLYESFCNNIDTQQRHIFHVVLTFQPLAGGGLVNSLLLCAHPAYAHDKLIIRINAAKTKMNIFDREFEFRLVCAIQSQGLAMRLFCRSVRSFYEREHFRLFYQCKKSVDDKTT